MLFGCKKKKEEQEVIITKISGEELILTPTRIPTLSPTPTLTPTPDPTPEGMEKSVLTGEWIPKEVANRRPYAVMLNNIKVASPQSGTQDADILYSSLHFKSIIYKVLLTVKLLLDVLPYIFVPLLLCDHIQINVAYYELLKSQVLSLLNVHILLLGCLPFLQKS